MGSKVYQRTTLRHVQKADISSIKQDFFDAIDLHQRHHRNVGMIVYGELMCNADLYGYSGQGLSGRWLPFGAILSLSNIRLEEAVEIQQRMQRANFVFSVVEKAELEDDT